MADSRDIIRERILTSVNDIYDKSTGSLTWELSQGLGLELESKYIEIDDSLEQKFAGTADFENLKVIAYERGIDWKPATKASGIVKITGMNGSVIKEGDLVGSELNEYVITETKTIGISGFENVNVECTVLGSQGNTLANTINRFPKTLVGLNLVTNELAFTNGYSEETREELLQRYYNEVRRPATSGNAYHYQKWAESVTGVGMVKVKPIWNGAGTVKVLVIDRNKELATTELIQDVATYIETVRPIGASVTVSTGDKLTVNVSARISVKNDFTIDQVTTSITNSLKQYFKDITFVDLYVFYAKIGNIIFNTAGVADIDYNLLLINGLNKNIGLVDSNVKTEVPTLGTLTLTQ
jgi:uncharacterized phage protein gp47/JayE